MFWVISVYFNIRNTLPKSGIFLLGHPVFFVAVVVRHVEVVAFLTGFRSKTCFGSIYLVINLKMAHN